MFRALTAYLDNRNTTGNMPDTVKAIRIHKTGGPEVMRWEDVEIGLPNSGEVRLRHSAVGLNYIDVGHRSGSYPLPALPAVIGMEGAGVIEALGKGVSGFAVGDRVSYCMVLGSYSLARIINADRLIKLDDDTSEETAAAATLQGLTAHYLVRELYPVREDDIVLVQAAAGGVGLLLCQWAKHLGATVLGTVGTKEKAALATAHGCDHPILYRETDFGEVVLELTKGRGVNVIYDAVGKDTFDKGLDVLAERGWMVSYGQSSGPPPPVEVARLGPKGLNLTRGGLNLFVRDPEIRARNAAELFGLINDGVLKVEINQRYPLAEAATAHADLEGRKTTGSTILES
jgi:NADPH2:quinone reductase